MKLRRRILVTLIIMALAVIAVIRFRTPEDTWIRDSSGQWVKHGNPSAPMPK